MDRRLLLGFWRCMLPVPPAVWRKQVDKAARRAAASLGFMTTDHHRVRDLTVLGLPRVGAPLAPEWFSARLDLPLDLTVRILDDLESHLTFLYRNPEGAVAWAYPVTVDETPHRVAFSAGERVNAA